MKKIFLTRFFLLLGVILALGIIFSDPLLTSVSEALVYEDTLVPAEAIVVLSGSSTGNRIKTAARLYHLKLGKKLLFSGFEVYPGTYTSTLMKTYALSLGVPAQDILTMNTLEEVSTRGESIANLNLLKKNRIKSFILVTSAFHTRRSHLIYKKTMEQTGKQIPFWTYPAPDSEIPIQGWWRLRTGQKGIFLEYVKLIAYYLG